MDNALINRYMKIIEPLRFDLKLELLARLTESLQRAATKPETDKQSLLEELYGSWSDVDDEVLEDILKSRSTSNREIDLD